MKKLVIMIVMMAAAMSAAAQTEAKTAAKRNVTPEERIERQVKRMQSELMLSDDASSKFESLYKDYLSDLRKEADKVAELRKEINKKRADNTLKEKDIKNLQEKQLTLEKKRVEIREKYYDKFSKILNAHQLQKVMFQSFEKRNGRGGNGIAKRVIQIFFHAKHSFCMRLRPRGCAYSILALRGACKGQRVVNFSSLSEITRVSRSTLPMQKR